METERAVRAVLARCFAIRHGRDVPLEELRREAALAGVSAEHVSPALAALKEQHLATETADGWRPSALPRVSRADAGVASFSWLHAG